MQTPEPRQFVAEILCPEITELLDQHLESEARDALAELLAPELADVLAGLDEEHRLAAFRLLPGDMEAEVFPHLPELLRLELMGELPRKRLAEILDAMPADDRATQFSRMSEALANQVLPLLSEQSRQETLQWLGYPAESVGRLMTPEFVSLRADWTVQRALEHIRRIGTEAESLDLLFVVDGRGRLIDELGLRKLLVAQPNDLISTLVDEKVISLQATDDREKAVELMNRYDQPVLPVTGQEGVLVGIVTWDDVADVQAAETTEDIQKAGGMEALDEPYNTISLLAMFRKRGVWLSLLFVGEMLTATAMGHYEEEIARAVVLSLFIPLIISSGGNAGSQASTLVIRAMALKEVRLRDWFRVFRREATCGLLLGILLGTIGLIRLHLWQFMGWKDYGIVVGPHHISFERVVFTVTLSVIVVVLWGTLAGSMLPLLLRRLRLDPAAISAPLIATLVDVSGLVIYFTTAKVLLHEIL